MDDKTKTVMLTMATGVIKKGLLGAGAYLAGHGIINSSQTETFVSLGMMAVGIGWSLWNDYGKAIVLSQLEVLKAKSLAQAATMREGGLAPVTTAQIAAQSPTLTSAEVAKTVATLPSAIQANVSQKPVTGMGTGLILFAVLILGSLGLPGDASAQTRPLQLKPLTGNLANDLGITKPAAGLTGNPLADIIGALDAKLLPDLQYALKLATASGSKVTTPCYQAWIDIINVRQKAVQDDATPPQALPMPDPHLITDFEKLVELRNSLQPDSEFMIRCSPVASMVKKDIVGFIGIVISGGAGLATLVPGL